MPNPASMVPGSGITTNGLLTTASVETPAPLKSESGTAASAVGASLTVTSTAAWAVKVDAAQTVTAAMEDRIILFKAMVIIL